VDPLSGIRDDNGTQIVMDIGGMLDVDSCEFGRIHGVFHDADTVAHKGEILRLRTMDVADRRLGGGGGFRGGGFRGGEFRGGGHDYSGSWLPLWERS
jgi:uncharacterized membrane protein YgcG